MFLQTALSRQGIYHNIHPKTRIINGQETFVPEIVVPLAAVIFVAVQDADLSVDRDRFEIVVHEVVAPAVQLEGGGRRAIGKFEKTVVNRMVVGDFLQGFRAKRPGHFLLKRLGKKAVDIVVAIVDEHETAILHIPFEMVALLGRKFHQLMPAQIAEWAFEYFVTAQLYDFFLLVDRDRGVLNQRMQQIGRHSLVGIPVTGGVLDSGEEKRFQY